MPAQVEVRGHDFAALGDDGRALEQVLELADVAGERIALQVAQRDRGQLRRLRQARAARDRLEHRLLPWTTFVIVPVFALANAGVALGGGLGEAVAHPVTLGVVAGLVFGKQLGILLAAQLVVRTGIGSLPAGIRWRHIYGQRTF